jgi:hypothetical protein
MKFLLASATIAFIISADAMAQPHHGDDHHNYKRGESYNKVPRSTVVIPFRNYNYRYSNGYFFRPYGNTFRIVIPPVGIFINVLAAGYRTIHHPGGISYYYNGVYYAQVESRYQVIDAPVGARISPVH